MRLQKIRGGGGGVVVVVFKKRNIITKQIRRDIFIGR
jgi:hypothetical protein